jgi:hypothetical protein
MTKLEAYRLVVAEAGNVSAEQLASLIEQRFGLKIEPKYIPLFNASVQEQEKAARQRRAAQAAALTDAEGMPQPN